MAKVVKEIIIMLLVFLVTLLLFAVIFYEYIPARKNVVEIETYSETSKVSDLLADDIDKQEKDVLLTYQGGEYEVTSSDLKNYQATDKYVPGKADPFSEVKSKDSDEASDATTNSTSKNSDTNKSDTNTTSTKGTSSNKKSATTDNTVDENKTNTFIDDKGTK